jgi:hypothetical protein
MADSPTPLATSAQMTEGQFADLVRDYTPQALSDLMIEATRACEGICSRRLAPFTVTESHRATGIDPDEYTDASNLPLDLMGTLGRSYAYALGASSLVRHVWLNEYAPRYPDMWAYSNMSVQIVRSYGGSQPVSPAQILSTEPDRGHVFFSLGLFLPIGSDILVTYSGGYTVNIPADLVRANKYMAASIAMSEIDPAAAQSTHDPGELEGRAERLLTPYMRE